MELKSDKVDVEDHVRKVLHASSTKSSAKIKRLILQLPAVTPLSTRLLTVHPIHVDM